MKNTIIRASVPWTTCIHLACITLAAATGCDEAAGPGGATEAADDGSVSGSRHAAVGPLFVSLTFDDSRSSQRNAGAILAANGVRGTFYINSAELGSSGYYMTLNDIRTLAAGGNEIGGHTLNHEDLTSVSTSEAIAQVCQDQAQIQAWGFAGVSFAYPYGSTNSNAQAIVRDCKSRGYAVTNYLSARSIGDLQCSGCLAANGVPPANAFDVGTPGGSPTTSTTLDDFKQMVTNAEATGGWLVLPFHSVCNAPSNAPAPGNVNDCKDQYSVNYDTLNTFVQWLKARASLGTTIRTVQEVMTGISLPPVDAGTPPPVDAGSADAGSDAGTSVDAGTSTDAGTSSDAGADAGGPPPASGNLVQNASFETDANSDGRPDCFKLDGYGSNSYTYARVSTGAHSGTYAEQVTISSLSSGDRKIITAEDTTSCTLLATVGKTYAVSGWYKSSQRVRIAVYYHDAGGWHWWAESPYSAASTAWARIQFTTPAIPAGADRWAYGLALTSAGTMTVDDFSATSN